jgi:hypothetical protein
LVQGDQQWESAKVRAKAKANKMAKNSMMGGMSAGPSKDWQAECDAHALAQAKEISADPKRLKAAANVAKKMAEEHVARAKAMKSIARKGK